MPKPPPKVTVAHRVCHEAPKDHRARKAKVKLPPFVPIGGSFAPPPGTLLMGVGRQPDGFTCGTETFIGICEFLRLPIRDPDDDDVESYKKKLKTSYKFGTDPADIARVAREYLGIEARVATKLSVSDLDELSRGAQDYAGAVSRGKKPVRPLSVAMVTYQAYVTADHDKSLYFPRGRKGPRKILPIRNADGSILWENDWSDGHWSAVSRVVLPRERKILREIRRQLGERPRVGEIDDGIVILADPSNGEGLSFVPISEWERRWHDTDRDDRPRFRQAAVILTVPPHVLCQMQEATRRAGVPTFATVAHNAVVYVP
ncbi:MAG TPA: hypothetical protein VLE97_11375 [Gaiellaceae bacterium]|nr:hypothetical protein [Gaiellaceae bacterium]